MIPQPLAAIVFDMDGLLLDTETVCREAIFRSCADLGYAMTDELFLSLVGSPKEANDKRLTSHFGAAFPLPDFENGRRAWMRELCASSVKLKPGARDLLEFLKSARISSAVATSSGRDEAEEHLRHAGVLPLIDVLVAREDVTHGKPHPESFLRAAELLAVRPQQCLALEDSYNGVRAAHGAGMATIMVPDMLPATPEMRILCVGVMQDLRQVQAAIERVLSLAPGLG